MTLKIGDVVQLKSGGPLMTVSLLQDTTVRCIWFNEQGGVYDLKWGDFKPDTLKAK